MRSKTFRHAVALAGVALVSSAAPAATQDAKEWPNKPVRLIVNFAPGGSADNSMRPFADRLSKALGQQFVIENRGGASGAIGLEAVAKAAPDGYTYGVTPSLSLVILPHLRKVTFDPLADFAPVSAITDGTLVFAVHPTLPVKSVPELVAWGKQNPGKLAWGTAGVGSYGHLICEAFKLKSGLDITHVPYRGGGESLADFLANVVQLHADPNTMPHATSGKARLLAVFDRNRRPDFPDVPLMKEVYPDLDYILWFGVLAPKGTPPAIVRKFADELNKVGRDPEIKALLFKAALTPNQSSPDDMAALTKKDFDRYGELIRSLKIKVE